MKALSKTILTAVFSLTLLVNLQLFAGNPSQIVTICNSLVQKISQAAGEAQQVESMASNGNTNQLSAKITNLDGSLAEIGSLYLSLAQATGSTESLSAMTNAAYLQYNQLLADWNNRSAENSYAIANAAGQLQQALQLNKIPQGDIRQEVVNMKNED